MGSCLSPIDCIIISEACFELIDSSNSCNSLCNVVFSANAFLYFDSRAGRLLLLSLS